jgi:cation diffusion facilitator family transporter
VTGSVAVFSEVVHSGSDLVAAIVAFWAIRAAQKPPDRDHPYGHDRAENLAALLQGALVVAAGTFVAVEAARRLFGEPEPVRQINLAVAVMAASAAIALLVSLRLRSVAKRTRSAALAADALHLATDVWTATAVLAGLIVVRATGARWIDAAVALAVSVLVIATGMRLCWSSANVLADSNLPDDEIVQVEAVLAEFAAEGLSFHKLRGRQAGRKRHIDLHMVVPPETTVREGHQLSGRVKHAVTAAIPNAEVLIHLEDH